MIGSLQITIPAGCMNNCSFCVYKQHSSKFRTIWCSNHEKWSKEIERRLRYAVGRVDSVMITSHGEPTLNMEYIRDVVGILNKVAPSLAHIEIQTSGVGLTDDMLDLLFELGVRVISLSIPALDKERILEIMQVPERYQYNPLVLSQLIRSKGFILRLSIAMTDWFDNYAMESILSELTINWKPDQVSFKKLFGADSVASKNYDDFIKQFKSCAEYKRLELLSLGVWKYDVHGIGVVWNDDCMVSNEHETPRYLILQPDGRLYTRWDSKASAIF